MSLIPIPMIKADPLFMGFPNQFHIWNHNLYLLPKHHRVTWNPLQSVLSSNSNTSTGFFYFSTSSSHPDVALQPLPPRGDVSAAVCQECIVSTSRDAVEKCPRLKQVTIWHEKCMLTYSNEYTLLVRINRIGGCEKYDECCWTRFNEVLGEVIVEIF